MDSKIKRIISQLSADYPCYREKSDIDLSVVAEHLEYYCGQEPIRISAKSNDYRILLAGGDNIVCIQDNDAVLLASPVKDAIIILRDRHVIPNGFAVRWYIVPEVVPKLQDEDNIQISQYVKAIVDMVRFAAPGLNLVVTQKFVDTIKYCENLRPSINPSNKEYLIDSLRADNVQNLFDSNGNVVYSWVKTESHCDLSFDSPLWILYDHDSEFILCAYDPQRT